jgi:O-antigen/teichoic acid export membrane protein
MCIQTNSPGQGVAKKIPGYWSKVRRSFPFASNVAVLSGGASLGHCFTVAAAPFLTRLYLPHDIGNLGLFNAFLAVIVVTTSLQYDVAIVSASDEREAAHLTKLSMLFAVPISLAGGLLLYAMIHYSLVGFGTLPAYAAGLMVPTMCFAGLFSILRYWSLRHESFGIVSHAFIFQNGGRSVLQVALGTIGLHSFGLLLGEVFGRGMGMSRMARKAFPVIRKYALSKNDAAKTLARNRQFPLYSMPSSLINQLGTSLPLPVLVTLYGADAGGYYALVFRVMAVPAVLVGSSMADAFHSRAALYAREQPQRVLGFFHSTSAVLLAIGIVPALFILFFGEPTFAFAFGIRWKLSGTIAKIVAPWFLASFVVAPVSRLVYVLHGQRLKLIYDFLILGGNVMVFVFALHLGWTMLGTLKIMSGVNTACIIVYYLVLLRIATTGMRRSSMRRMAA